MTHKVRYRMGTIRLNSPWLMLPPTGCEEMMIDPHRFLCEPEHQLAQHQLLTPGPMFQCQTLAYLVGDLTPLLLYIAEIIYIVIKYK